MKDALIKTSVTTFITVAGILIILLTFNGTSVFNNPVLMSALAFVVLMNFAITIFRSRST
ncbi:MULTISPECIES: hypothetical protein [Bacillaceae]|uniref:Uncharacterized protein n=1 Tax=Alkalicoccobacillus plakortidis TaxID=444060 RepID=A0A9D5DL54_9BACI|nr:MULTISPECIES: hypothetical protein [Bacillaceae]KQL55943.1 hypothetical protein AN965_16860 [Alkalicoccobacillus plakortidis]